MSSNFTAISSWPRLSGLANPRWNFAARKIVSRFPSLIRSWLSCSGFNPKAQRFYLARGYQQVGCETKPRACGVLEEMLIYECRLPRTT